MTARGNSSIACSNPKSRPSPDNVKASDVSRTRGPNLVQLPTVAPPAGNEGAAHLLWLSAMTGAGHQQYSLA